MTAYCTRGGVAPGPEDLYRATNNTGLGVAAWCSAYTPPLCTSAYSLARAVFMAGNDPAAQALLQASAADCCCGDGCCGQLLVPLSSSPPPLFASPPECGQLSLPPSLLPCPSMSLPPSLPFPPSLSLPPALSLHPSPPLLCLSFPPSLSPFLLPSLPLIPPSLSAPKTCPYARAPKSCRFAGTLRPGLHFAGAVDAAHRRRVWQARNGAVLHVKCNGFARQTARFRETDSRPDHDARTHKFNYRHKSSTIYSHTQIQIYKYAHNNSARTTYINPPPPKMAARRRPRRWSRVCSRCRT